MKKSEITVSDFVLIDLRSQHRAFYSYTRGWLIEDILDWMRHYGEVIKTGQGSAMLGREIVVQPQNMFIFYPNCCLGLHAYFWLEDNGFVILTSAWFPR